MKLSKSFSKVLPFLGLLLMASGLTAASVLADDAVAPVTPAVPVAPAAPAVPGDTSGLKSQIQKDRAEIRKDTQALRQENQVIRVDRQKLREDRAKDGKGSEQVKDDVAKLKTDHEQKVALKKDRAKSRKDLRDLRRKRHEEKTAK